MERLISPLSERAEEWRRGCTGGTGALGREHARECKRARAELRRRVQEAQRHARKARRAAPDAKRRADVCMQVRVRRVIYNITYLIIFTHTNNRMPINNSKKLRFNWLGPSE